MGVLITPWRWDIPSIPLKGSRGISAKKPVGWMMCFVLKTLVPAQVLHLLYPYHTF